MLVTETVYLPTRRQWRAWLARHHAKKTEIWFIFYKKASGKPSVPYAEAVEEALCYGWIDATVKTLDTDRYVQRFSPRKKGSNWSAPNLDRVKRLIAAGLMTPAGAVHVPSARAAKVFRAQHTHRTTATTIAPRDLSTALRANVKAAAFWKALTPGYKRLYVRMINDAKRPETRAKRIKDTVARLARGVKHPQQ
jgi:uncharacterized protein YdeI (YjbR/CyaY-like superfamily)